MYKDVWKLNDQIKELEDETILNVFLCLPSACFEISDSAHVVPILILTRYNRLRWPFKNYLIFSNLHLSLVL
jgi:hypothetical protein